MKVTYFLLLVGVALVSACNDLCKLHLHSPAGSVFYNYFPFINNRIEFQIRSAGPVRILLANDYAPNRNPNYEIIIGYNGTQNVRVFRDGNLLALRDGPLYDPNTFRAFGITTNNGVIRVRTNIDMEIISHRDIIYVPTRIVGVAADSGVAAELLYDCKQFIDKCSS